MQGGQISGRKVLAGALGGAVGGAFGYAAGRVTRGMMRPDGKIDCNATRGPGSWLTYVGVHAAAGAASGAASYAIDYGLDRLAGEDRKWDNKEFLFAIGLGATVGAVSSIGQLMNNRVCFVAGTPLLTPDGAKAIEDFRPGDLVLSRNELDPEGPVEAKVIEEVFERHGPAQYLTIGGQRIGTTAAHPFWVRGKGWLPAAEIVVGDHLLGHDGRWAVVAAKEDSGGWQALYNLNVTDFHTYFVGCAEWRFDLWAHNLDYSQKEDIAKEYQKHLDKFGKRSGRAFFAQAKDPDTGNPLTPRQIRDIKDIANHDTTWTRPAGMKGPRPAESAPVEDQRQNMRVAEETKRLTDMGHEIKGGGRYIDEATGKPLKLGSEKELPGIDRWPDITAFGPVGPQGPVPKGTTGPGIVEKEYHVNVGPNESPRNGGGPTAVEQTALDKMRDAGHTVFYVGYGQRNR
jgi:hypothetical protein